MEQNDLKIKYFRRLQDRLAQRYMLTVDTVSFVRDEAVGNGRTKKEIIYKIEDILFRKKRAVNNINPDIVDRNDKLKYDFRRLLYTLQAYKNLLFFLKKATPEVWADLTQITPYDKKIQQKDSYRKDPAHEMV